MSSYFTKSPSLCGWNNSKSSKNLFKTIIIKMAIHKKITPNLQLPLQMMLTTPLNNHNQTQHKNRITFSLMSNNSLHKKLWDSRNFNTQKSKCLLCCVMASRAAPMIWVSYIRESKLNFPMQAICSQGVMKLIQRLIFKKWVKGLLIKLKDT